MSLAVTIYRDKTSHLVMSSGHVTSCEGLWVEPVHLETCNSDHSHTIPVYSFEYCIILTSHVLYDGKSLDTATYSHVRCVVMEA